MLVFDCEIINGIENDVRKRKPGIRYCEGWTDFVGMGISCICAYDFRAHRHRVFLEDNFHVFSQLVAERELVVGFNNHRFDDPLCMAHGIHIPAGKSFDLMEAILCGVGHDRDRHRGLSLDNIARVNLNRGKAGAGEDAPALWQKGKYGAVIDYCLNDVFLTSRILQLVLSVGSIMDPRPGNEGNVIPVQQPVTEEKYNGN